MKREIVAATGPRGGVVLDRREADYPRCAFLDDLWPPFKQLRGGEF